MQIKKIGETKIAVMPERLDANASLETENGLIDIIKTGVKNFICDFSQTEYISSAGLRVLIKAAKKTRQENGRIILFGLKEYVMEVLETAGFVQLFKIVKTQEEALENINFTFGWDSSNI